MNCIRTRLPFYYYLHSQIANESVFLRMWRSAQGKFARLVFANVRTSRLYAVLIKSLCKNINHSIKISKYTHTILSNNQFVRTHRVCNEIVANESFQTVVLKCSSYI